MEVCRRSSWLLLLLGVSLLATTLQGVQGEAESEGPSESECRPYIEKALKELEIGEVSNTGTPEIVESSKEDVPTAEVTTDDSGHQEGEGEDETHEEGHESIESVESDQNIQDEQHAETEDTTQEETSDEGARVERAVEEETEATTEDTGESHEAESAVSAETETEKVEEPSVEQATEDEATTTEAESKEQSIEGETAEHEDTGESVETTETPEEVQEETIEESIETQQEEQPQEGSQETEEIKEATEEAKSAEGEHAESVEGEQAESVESQQTEGEQAESVESEHAESVEGEQAESVESQQAESQEVKQEESVEAEQAESLEAQPSQEQEETKESEETKEDTKSEPQDHDKSEGADDDKSETKEDTDQQETGEEQEGGSKETEAAGESDHASTEQSDSTPDVTGEEESQKDQPEEAQQAESEEGAVKSETESEEGAVKAEAESEEGAGKTEEETTHEEEKSSEAETGGDDESKSVEEGESAPEEELSLDIEVPTDLREREHVEHLLKIDAEASETEKIINRISEITLRELKKLYENAIKPLEVLYKYRDLSNRHFGDAEIFSKPLILFMGPWSGGKSSIINYLLDNEYNETSLRTGAEPSPAYFNILMFGEEPEILDGTQLAADFTFSGLQKFGQGLEERLRGVKLPSKLLEKVNIVEIPGILEVRKQVSRVFPFNDACQWFIDRADIIFLVYDPSKLDVGPETEAILDQLKGREHQTRIILNKADQVKPEELMRVQGALIWNISPLMSSAQPPIMYTTSLWSRPYESWAPVRLLQAQERAFLRDLRSAIDKRIENKIASARRFAVRVRNHAKMVDCYLTTYYNHKSVFGNRKQVADEIIEHPQDYHIYEGLSTLTNISRYDLPDPDVYRDFFKLNPLYDFQQLSATCTYFRGCPINRLDVAIAYDLPELVGKHKRLVESALAEANPTPVPGS